MVVQNILVGSIFLPVASSSVNFATRMSKFRNVPTPFCPPAWDVMRKGVGVSTFIVAEGHCAASHGEIMGKRRRFLDSVRGENRKARPRCFTDSGFVASKSGQGRIRTADTRLFRPLLYHLSYLTQIANLIVNSEAKVLMSRGGINDRYRA